VQHIRESGVTPRLVRIEGVMLSGKSTLADMLAAALRHANVVHVDEFAYEDKSNRPYAEAINVSALNARLGRLLQSPCGRFSTQYVSTKWHRKLTSAEALSSM
jgi:energy-coupling factor transporter ATP-binding protein EcfA2